MKSIFPGMYLLIALAFCPSAFGQVVGFDARPEPGKEPASIADYSAAFETISGVQSIIAGRLSVSVDIDEAGNVVRVNSVSGPGNVCPSTTRTSILELRMAAESAARTVRFNPATLSGLPAPSSGQIYFLVASPDVKESDANEYTGNYMIATGKNVGGTKEAMEQDQQAGKNPQPDYVGRVNTVGSGASVQADPDDNATSPRSNFPSRPISGGVLNGKAVSLPKPPYPAAARAVRASGAVTIQILVDEDGTIFSAQGVSGHPLLRQASRMAACEARFNQTRLQGKPVKVQGVITYNYVAP
ncbi:MAG: energy transducer TonB [Acidobacteria bacterium]|nr:energy transducer TonB [Acidobacteriota bacterium]